MALVPPSHADRIALVPTADLIVALLDRYDHAVFAGIQDRPSGPQKTDAMTVTSRRYVGDPYKCMGVAHGVISMCQRAIDNATEEMSPDDL